MIIGIDGNEANVEKKVGVSVYTANLLHYFQKRANSDLQFRIYLREPPHYSSSFGLALPEESSHFTYRVVKGPAMWSQLFLPADLYLKRGINVFFSPAHYAPRYCPVPVVTTIHDVAYFYYPQEFIQKDLYQLKNWTGYSIAHSKKIITVSKTTKKDVMKFYNVPDGKIEVVYNGFEKTESHLVGGFAETAKRYDILKHTYLLYVSTLQPRKDVPTLIEAFSQLRASHPQYKLVIVGRKGWMYDEIFTRVQEQNLDKSVVFTGYLPDDEVVALYQNAFCFVLPSLYEGFGITILEAMSHGCPVITTYASSLPEVGGEACLYFEPKSPQDLLFNIDLLIKDADLRKNLIEKGRERTKQFSWEKCANETLQVLTSTAL